MRLPRAVRRAGAPTRRVERTDPPPTHSTPLAFGSGPHPTAPAVRAHRGPRTALAALGLTALLPWTVSGCGSAQPEQDAGATGSAQHASSSEAGSEGDPQGPGKGPQCPEDACFSLAVTGDLLLHEGLWRNFATTAQGTDFDFGPLLANQRQYLDRADLAVCDAETPVAQAHGPYADYPSFNVPPQIFTAAHQAGYDACTAATNHTVDRGTEGVNRTLDALDAAGLAHTGSYRSEREAQEPLLLETPSGTLGLVTGTNSLNGQQAEHEWQVDRLRDAQDTHEDPEAAQRDIDRAVSMAKKARERGADVVVAAMHSIVEYTDTADDYQQRTAHALADSGEFDAIYGHGSHSVQPIEHYDGTWIVYGVGNTVTETSPAYEVNNQGLMARFQFARAGDGSWRVSDLSWAPSSNVQGTDYRWCSVASDAPDGTCRSAAEDREIRERIAGIVGTDSAREHGLREWRVSEEQQR